LKGRPWPAVLGSGIGLGMAYANCQTDFQKPFQEKAEIIKITDPKLIEKITNSIK
jgi:inner membrane organizing system protein 1